MLDELRPDPAAASPLYLQLVERIAAAIACGRLKDGEALPPERVLSERLEVSRTTVRKALDELTARGLVTSRHGSGNFVAARLEQPLARLSSFSEDMRARGRRPGFVWVERGVFAPSPEEVIALGLGSGEQVARFVRVRLADDEPLAVERAAIAAAPPAGPRRRSRARSTRPCARAASSRCAPSSTCAPRPPAPPTPSTSTSRPAARSWRRCATAISPTAGRSSSPARSIAATATISSPRCAAAEKEAAMDQTAFSPAAS